ncbi:Ger(x)C family spore germination protein [Tumebacillus permanentifrigoris]|uniref:Spore germination protein n=1 Tax=Tumebacillus permanentifrigoris TaxID=378543 RepID=A0A316D4X4_9BACL|nr:Ger(x)C family spore germination protein [Tumebacillus permanentifrigoris]PWK07863.1 spore germination protein [Tumebacillus permanentifrigoris]
MRARRVLLISLALSLFTTGCMRTNILEQTGLILMVGYDDAGENKIRGTSLLYQVDPRAKEHTQVISSVSASSKGSREINNLGMAKKLVSGQLRVALYSDELVRKNGLFGLVDTLSRDANVGRMVYIAVCRGQAQDLMAYRYPETSNLGSFLYQDLKQNTLSGNLPSATLHEFIRDYYEVGRDPVLPILEKEKNKVSITGIALFQNDRLAGETSTRNGYYIKSFRDPHKPMYLEVRVKSQALKPVLKQAPSKSETAMMFSTLKQKPQIKLLDPQNLRFQITLQISAELLEVSEPVDLSKPETEKQLADAIGHQMSLELHELLTQFISLKTDPIGLGEIYRSSVRGSHFTRDEWHEMLSKAQLDTRVEVMFVRTGIVD